MFMPLPKLPSAKETAELLFTLCGSSVWIPLGYYVVLTATVCQLALEAQFLPPGGTPSLSSGFLSESIGQTQRVDRASALGHLGPFLEKGYCNVMRQSNDARRSQKGARESLQSLTSQPSLKAILSSF